MPPHVSTCMGRVIELFVVAEDLGGATVQAITIDDALCKPHRPVRLYIRARPRMMTVRALKKMGSLDAKLPFGPAQKVDYNHSDLDGLSNHEKYRLFLTRMEMEVAGLMGIDGKELEAISGRA